MYYPLKETLIFYLKFLAVFYIIYFIVGGILIVNDHNRRKSIKRKERLEEIKKENDRERN